MGKRQVFFCDDEIGSSDFLGSFLSQEMNTSVLVALAGSVNEKFKGNAKKNDLVKIIIGFLESRKISSDDILQAYVKTSRMWLSFKIGSFKVIPKKRDASSLLREFGEPGWYGPINDKSNETSYYIYVKKVAEPLQFDEEGKEVLKYRYYRWSVIAKVTKKYAALSWFGFGCKDDPEKRDNQFPFWKYIPFVFDELSEMTEASWEFPDLYNLVLEKLWGKYLDDVNYSESYDWRHLRIKAESSGVALNAKSSPSGPSEINLEGLLALANALATTSMSAFADYYGSVTDFKEKDGEVLHDLLKNNILKTLIKDWGAMAYEFQLDRLEDDKLKRIKIFRAYCNFGKREELGTEDALIHLKCFSSYGNSNGALDFLIKEMLI